MKPMNIKQAKDVMAAHLMTVAFSSAHADPEVVMAWKMISEILNREMAKKKKL
ncbi:hypothetical protein N9M03_00905 [bacterium]|nr:hypothetical protein [bacterium]